MYHALPEGLTNAGEIGITVRRMVECIILEIPRNCAVEFIILEIPGKCAVAFISSEFPGKCAVEVIE